MRGLRSALLAQIVASATVAQGSPEPVRLTRLDQQIVFDGNPDEPAWHNLVPFTLVQYQPISGAQPTESSDIRVSYDAEYLYVGARFSGSSSADMRSLERRPKIAGTAICRRSRKTTRTPRRGLAADRRPR